MEYAAAVATETSAAAASAVAKLAVEASAAVGMTLEAGMAARQAVRVEQVQCTGAAACAAGAEGAEDSCEDWRWQQQRR